MLLTVLFNTKNAFSEAKLIFDAFLPDFNGFLLVI